MLRIMVNNKSIGYICCVFKDFFVPLTFKNTKYTHFYVWIYFFHSENKFTGSFSVNVITIFTVFLVIRMPVTVDFVTNFPIFYISLFGHIGVFHPCSSFLGGSTSKVCSKHSFCTSLFKPF